MAPRHDRRLADRESKTAPLSIVYRRVEELRTDPCNPRRHSRKQIQQIAQSIRAFGFTVPCLIDEQMRIVSGHGRLAAARYLGIAEIPTISVEHLSEYQRRVLQIADNKLTETSAWDKRLLAEQFQSLQGLNLDFSLDNTGFELPQIELLIANSEPVRKKSDTTSEKLLDSEIGVTVTLPGDVWALGRHRVVRGNPSDAQQYSLLMQEHRAELVFTPEFSTIASATKASGSSL